MTADLGCLMCRGKKAPPGARCRHCGRRGPVLKHGCHARGCGVEVPPKMLMCLRHWRMVPRTVQKLVWAAYVPGQEVHKDPTHEYLRVMDMAIEAVAEKEGRS